MGVRENIIAVVNLTLAALLVLGALGWSFIQGGCHSYFQKEAIAFFQSIETEEIKYRNVNNRFLPFSLQDSAKGLKELKIDPKKAVYFDYSVEQTDRQTISIIAQLKPEVIKRYYLNNPRTKFRLLYERREGEKGRLIQ